MWDVGIVATPTIQGEVSSLDTRSGPALFTLIA